MDPVALRIDGFPDRQALAGLWLAAWGHAPGFEPAAVLQRSLCHVTAHAGGRLVGFVNVAWDGGLHGFLLDTCVHPEVRRRGIATRLVAQAAATARQRGAQWLHVDFEPQLEAFYRGCGFRPTSAGLLRL